MKIKTIVGVVVVFGVSFGAYKYYENAQKQQRLEAATERRSAALIAAREEGERLVSSGAANATQQRMFEMVEALDQVRHCDDLSISNTYTYDISSQLIASYGITRSDAVDHPVFSALSVYYSGVAQEQIEDQGISRFCSSLYDRYGPQGSVFPTSLERN